MSKKIFFKFDNFQLSGTEYIVDSWANIGFFRNHITNIPPNVQLGFRFSQVVEYMIYYIEKNAHLKPDTEKLVFQHIDVENDSPYIVAITVQYSPSDWTDCNYLGNRIPQKSIFEHINPRYIEDLKNGKAILLIDQSVEGYSADWLWDWFHQKCFTYKINPNNIIYLTGDQSCADTYNDWCDLHQPSQRLKVIPSISLSMFIRKHVERYQLNFNFDELLNYKKENTDKIYLYDCLNKRPRKQRVFNFMHLFRAGLLDDGNVTMPAVDTWKDWINFFEPSSAIEALEQNGFYTHPLGLKLKPEQRLSYNPGMGIVQELKNSNILPKVANYKYDHDTSHYFSLVERVIDDLYKHSWVSLVVESSYYKDEHSVFLSEKTFKPIAAMQPFIIVGSKHSLKYLRELGYKTFHPYIDESYDDLDDDKRFLSIMESLKKIKAIENKAAWYESMRHIIEHNYNLFRNIGTERAKEHQEILNYYFDYCNRYNGGK